MVDRPDVVVANIKDDKQKIEIKTDYRLTRDVNGPQYTTHTNKAKKGRHVNVDRQSAMNCDGMGLSDHTTELQRNAIAQESQYTEVSESHLANFMQHAHNIAMNE